jgi:GT2 family glycosyltransferase
MHTSSLSIIITSYRNPELLKLCINSIKNNIAEDFNYEIIVADSATEESTEMMMREDFPEVTFFGFEKNVGFQVVVNKGIDNSKGDYLLILNGDMLIKKHSVERLLDYLQSNPTVGIVGPKLLSFNGEFQYSCFRFYKPITIIYRRTFFGKLGFAKKHLDKFLMKDYDHQRPIDVDWLMGSALMMRADDLKKVGKLDPAFFMYMEDVDWCRRFWEKGLRVVYFPYAEMLHYHGKGSEKKGFIYSIFFNKLTWIHIASAIKYFKKYLGKPNPRKEYK